MEQLKMYWLYNGGTEAAVELPKNLSFSNYRGEEDVAPWLEICRNGLIQDTAGTEIFERAILKQDGVRPERDLFFLDDCGEHIGTFTAYRIPGTDMGDFHMVSIRTDQRGKRFSRYLCERAIRKFIDDGCRSAVLTTDDWRLGAIKSYLSAGWLPVEYDTGMEERWRNVLRELKIDSVRMLTDDGKEYKIIDAAKEKPHCDAMVLECVDLVEEFLREYGKIGSDD